MQYKRGYKNETGVMLWTHLFNVAAVKAFKVVDGEGVFRRIVDIFGRIGYTIIIKIA